MFANLGLRTCLKIFVINPLKKNRFFYSTALQDSDADPHIQYYLQAQHSPDSMIAIRSTLIAAPLLFNYTINLAMLHCQVYASVIV